jgi:hypothetical protein
VSISAVFPTISAEAQRVRLSAQGVTTRIAVTAGLAVATGYVYLQDPDKGGTYPQCPSRLLLGIDCPACGGLRGTNALLHGRVGEALDHNLLLPVYLGGFALFLGLWLLPLFGLRERRLRLPRWVGAVAIGGLMAFMLVRNLPIDSLHYLRSDA